MATEEIVRARRRPSLTKWGAAIAVLVVGGMVAGCGSASTSTPSVDQGLTPPPVQATEQPSTKPSHTPPARRRPADFISESESKSGDRVKLEGRFGPPLPVNQTDADPTALESCEGADQREMVVRLDLTATVQSRLSGHVSLGFRAPYQNERALRPPQFLMGYSEGPSCTGMPEIAGADLGTLEPHQPHDLTLWLVLPDVVTPRDPHPPVAVLARQEWLIELPEVWMDNGRLDASSATGNRVDECKPLPKSDVPLPGYENKEIALVAGTPRIIPSEHSGVCPS